MGDFNQPPTGRIAAVGVVGAWFLNRIRQLLELKKYV